MVNLELAPIVGRFTDDVWSQVRVFTDQGSETAGLSDIDGSLLLIGFQIDRTSTRTANEVGQAWLHEFEQAYADEQVKNLKPAALLALLRKTWANNSGELVLMLVRDSRVFLAGFGEVQVRLYRNTTTGIVLRGKADTWQALEGTLEEGDRWLLGTSPFVGEMDPALIDEIFSGTDLDQVGDDLVVQVQASDQSAGVAGFVIYSQVSDEVVVQDEVSVVVDEKKNPSVYVRTEEKRRRTALSVGIILLVLLIISIGFGWQRREAARYEDAYVALVSTVDEQKKRAEALAPTDLSLAKQALEQARTDLEAAQTTFEDQDDYLIRLANLLSELDTYSDQITGEHSLAEVPLWFDLSIVRDTMVGSQLQLANDSLLVLDTSSGLVAEVDLETKEGLLVGGGEVLNNSVSIAQDESRTIILSEAGLVELDTEGKVGQLLVEADPAWGAGSIVGAFGGNAYVYSETAQTITRYAGSTGDGTSWFDPGVVGPADAVAMAIDGDIWVLGHDGSIYRYQSGAAVTYEQQVLDTPIEAATALALDIDSERVFVLDANHSRVVVYDYDGKYLFQQQWNGFSGVSDIVVVDSYLYALSGSDIYEIKLTL